MKDILLELTRGLKSYNKSVNTAINTVNKSLMAVGFIIVGILFLTEMMGWYRYIRNQNGEMTWKLIAEIAFKYLIAFFLVSQSAAILNAIMWLTNGITKMVGVDLNANDFKYVPLKKGNIIIRGAINVLAYFAGGAATMSLKVIVFLRFIELYMLKAISPIIVAFWMSEHTKGIAINILKTFGAIALQGTIIVLLLVIWQGFKVDTAVELDSDGFWGAMGTGMSYIGKCIVFVILLFGSQRKAKSLLQAS